MPRELSKCREWEKDRRERLKKGFVSLSKILPCYEPSLNISKIEILQKAEEYIEELQTQIKEFLDGKSTKPEYTTVKKLHDRVKKLVIRNEQLCNLLIDAGIRLPSECGNVKKFRGTRIWSNRITSEQAKKLQKKEKENDQKKLKRRVQSKSRKIRNGACLQKRLSKKSEINGKQAVTLQTSNFITLVTTHSCFIITNAPSTNCLTKTTTVLTNSNLFSTPLVASAVKPPLVITKGNGALNTVSSGTLLVANGNLLPVLQQPAIVPTPTIITNPAPIVVKPAPAKNTTLFVVPKTDVKDTSGNKQQSTVTQCTTKTSVNSKTSNTSKSLPALKPKAFDLTKAPPINKVPIPALTSRYANDIIPQVSVSSNLKTAKGKSNKISKKELNTKTNNTESLLNEKIITDQQADKNEITKKNEIRQHCNVPNDKQNDDKVVNCEDEDMEPTIKKSKMSSDVHDEGNDDNKKINIISTYSIDSLCNDLSDVASAAPDEPKIDNSANIEETRKEDTENKTNEDCSVMLVDKEMAIPTTNSENQAETVTQQSKIQEDSTITPADNTSSAHDTNDTSKDLLDNKTKTKDQTNIVTEMNNPLIHSDLSNDIFASLSHVSAGGQNPESTSPTAAFLLAFPLVSSLNSLKVAEVIEDETTESQHGTPTLLQIGTMDSTKTTQSQPDNLTPNLLNLDNFSFFSRDFYPPFDSIVTSLSNTCTAVTSTSNKTPENKKDFIDFNVDHTRSTSNKTPENKKNFIDFNVDLPEKKVSNSETHMKNDLKYTLKSVKSDDSLPYPNESKTYISSTKISSCQTTSTVPIRQNTYPVPGGTSLTIKTCQVTDANSVCQNLHQNSVTRTSQSTITVSSCDNTTTVSSCVSTPTIPTCQVRTIEPVRQNATIVSARQNATIASARQNSTIVPTCQTNVSVSMCQTNTILPTCLNSTLTPTCQSNTIVPTCLNNTVVPMRQNNIPTCLNNTIIPSCQSNTIVSTCLSSTIIPTRQSNTMIPTCLNNTVIPSCQSNTLVTTCLSNRVIPTCQDSTVIPTCLSNTIIPSCQSKPIIPTSLSNTIIPSCQTNTIVSTCSSNTVTPTCQSNIIPTCLSSTVVSTCRSNVLVPACQSNTIASICQGHSTAQACQNEISASFSSTNANAYIGFSSSDYNMPYNHSFYTSAQTVTTSSTTTLTSAKHQLEKSKIPEKKTCNYYPASNSYSIPQYNTFNPFTDIPKSMTTYPSSTKSYNDGLYTNNSTYSYNYHPDNFTTTYPSTKTNIKPDKLYYGLNYDNYDYKHNNFDKYDMRNQQFGNYYNQNQIQTKEKTETPNKNIISANANAKMPVNWMTTPDIRQQAQNDFIVPPLGKDVDFAPNPIYTSNSFSAPQTTYFNTNTSLYSSGDLHNTAPFPTIPPNSFQRSDIEENQFSWSPSKLPQLIDTAHNFVSGTLPTLVGDLALGNTQPFVEQKVDNKISKDFRLKDNIRRSKPPNNYDNQTNFLSVSQLVDHNKNDALPSRVTNRRGSGNRSSTKASVSTKSSKRVSKTEKDITTYNSNKVAEKQMKQHANSQPNQDYQSQNNDNGTNWMSSNKSRNVKIPSSSYSAEALIGHQNQNEVNRSRNMQNYPMMNKSLPVPFLPDNIIPYFPMDIPQDNTLTQQNQNYQSTSFGHNFTPSIQGSVYSNSSFVPNAAPITTSYLPSTNFVPDIGTNTDYTPILPENTFTHVMNRTSDKYSKTKSQHNEKPSEKRNLTQPNNNCPVNSLNATKKSKKKQPTEPTLSNFDFSFLSMPAAINSPILPDDFHTHSNFLPPPTPTQLYQCKNPLYGKQDLATNSLLPLTGPSRSGVPHPEVSPSLNNVGNTLTNFNLSTIFPEINKVSGPIPDVYPDGIKPKDYNQRDFLGGTSQVPFKSNLSYINSPTSTN